MAASRAPRRKSATPPRSRSPRWPRAAVGIFGDFLFGEANRMGAGNLSSLGGPVATGLSRLYEIYNRWLQSIGTDHKGEAWAELARFGVDHVPFAGLFYLKGAANLWLHLF